MASKDKLSSRILMYIMGKASILGNQKHLTSLRDAFALLTPLIIVGALSVLIRTFIFGGGGTASTSILGWIARWSHQTVAIPDKNIWGFIPGSGFAEASSIGNWLFYGITLGTINSMAIFAAFGIGYFLSMSRGTKTPVIAGLLSLGAFLVSIGLQSSLMGAEGLLTAIIVSILTTELYCIFERVEKLQLKMPDGVPPAVARSFSKLFPTIIIIVIVVMLNLPFILFGVLTHIAPDGTSTVKNYTSWTLGNAISMAIEAPFLAFVGSNNVGLGISLIYVIFVGFFWFFGLHGTNILLGVFGPIFIALYAQNVKGAHHIFVQGTFDAFIFIGGISATLAFILSIFIFSKNPAEKEISKLALGPGIFQINEPVIFGIPLVLNVKYVIPFMFSMPLLTITTWLGYKTFNIHSVVIWIPWTTPIGLGGLLATAFDWKGMLLALINFGIAFALWTPFVIFWSRQYVSNLKSKDKIKKEKII